MILNRSYIRKNKHIFYGVAIGNFDGIHLGHRFLLNKLLSCKKSSKDKVAVITFNPHPIKILKPSVWNKVFIMCLFKPISYYSFRVRVKSIGFCSCFFFKNICSRRMICVRMSN